MGRYFPESTYIPDPTLKIDRFIVACFSNQKRKRRAGFFSPVIVRYCFPYTLHSPCWKHGKRKWKISRSEKLSTEAMIDRRKKSQLTQKDTYFENTKKKQQLTTKKNTQKLSVSVKPDSLHSPSWGNQTWCKSIVGLPREKWCMKFGLVSKNASNQAPFSSLNPGEASKRRQRNNRIHPGRRVSWSKQDERTPRIDRIKTLVSWVIYHGRGWNPTQL